MLVGVDAVHCAEDNTEARKWPSAEVPPRSKSTARSCGFPRNLGGPVVSVVSPAGEAGNQTLARACGARVHGSEQEHSDGTAERRKRSEAGRTLGIRSASYLPRHPRNRPPHPL